MITTDPETCPLQNLTKTIVYLSRWCQVELYSLALCAESALAVMLSNPNEGTMERWNDGTMAHVHAVVILCSLKQLIRSLGGFFSIRCRHRWQWQ